MGFLSLNDKRIDTVIFDFDGTLAELNIDFARMRSGVCELIARYGIAPRTLSETYVLELIAEASALLGGGPSQRFKAEAFGLLEDIEVRAAREGELFENTRDLLAALTGHGIRAGIITRNCARAVRTVFPDIGAYCCVVVSRDDVTRVKPHPEQITLALARLGGSASSAIMIGDHPIDIETGRNAGTAAAGVLTGRFQREDFLRAGADAVFSRAPDIVQLLC
ncbi:MAG: HAD family hydrolase [Smithellaceae bacterium]|nr:HAD family hydrolase [Syntrophaceae bacterium]MDD4240114.1 HAD family hydrolase [Smithellaceae bacterium]NLX51878.1 HAD family hydrolase [Deltaproteobacteria bacterium]